MTLPLNTQTAPGAPNLIRTAGSGTYRYVNSNGGGSTTSGGLTPESAFTTIDSAINASSAGDTIIVMEGHAESVAAAGGIDADVAGLKIIGLGYGARRPTITFDTDTGADFDVDAAEIYIANLIFQNDIDSQAIVLDVNAAGCTVENCDFLEGSSKQYLIGIDIAEDRCTVRNCYFKSVATGAASAIKIAAAKDRITIVDNEVFGDFSDACIHNPTGNVATRLSIRGNTLTNLQSGDHAIELVSACTGVIAWNVVNSSLAAVETATAVDPGACYCIENYGGNATDVSGVLNPAIDTA